MGHDLSSSRAGDRWTVTATVVRMTRDEDSCTGSQTKWGGSRVFQGLRAPPLKRYSKRRSRGVQAVHLRPSTRYRVPYGIQQCSNSWKRAAPWICHEYISSSSSCSCIHVAMSMYELEHMEDIYNIHAVNIRKTEA